VDRRPSRSRAVKLLLHEMLSPRIALELRSRGHDVVAIKERPDLQSLSDPEIVAAARREKRA
jgi:predicted nuclease of predicted toxin-antitoxin system